MYRMTTDLICPMVGGAIPRSGTRHLLDKMIEAIGGELKNEYKTKNSKSISGSNGDHSSSIDNGFMVYAVLLASYQGGNITITSIGGNIEYASENLETSFALPPFSQGAKAHWYARIAITGSPAQQVTVTWTLYNVTATAVVPTDVATTTITLTTGTQYIYASTNGLITGNENWGDHSVVAATYRVDAQINTV